MLNVIHEILNCHLLGLEKHMNKRKGEACQMTRVILNSTISEGSNERFFFLQTCFNITLYRIMRLKGLSFILL